MIGAFVISVILMAINVVFGIMSMEKVASTEAEPAAERLITYNGDGKGGKYRG